jgi:hypothetical protein
MGLLWSRDYIKIADVAKIDVVVKIVTAVLPGVAAVVGQGLLQPALRLPTMPLEFEALGVDPRPV